MNNDHTLCGSDAWNRCSGFGIGKYVILKALNPEQDISCHAGVAKTILKCCQGCLGLGFRVVGFMSGMMP